jgi:hypothetical protein
VFVKNNPRHGEVAGMLCLKWGSLTGFCPQILFCSGKGGFFQFDPFLNDATFSDNLLSQHYKRRAPAS